jgi:thiosulfate/3-mercaptopyruvate sulfurtransferase
MSIPRDTPLVTPLVTGDWLAGHLTDPAIRPNLRVVDASWYLPAAGRNGRSEYEAGHIPGAVFWDIDEIADKTSGLPHMMPGPDEFARHMEALGIGNDTNVVLYDGLGLFTAARPWWMLRAMGHENVAILDGGLPKWRAEGRPLSTEAAASVPTTFTPNMNSSFFHNINDLNNFFTSKEKQIIDARSASRFAGAEPEPRPGCRPGHIPGSLNAHYDAMLNPADKTVKNTDGLKALFEGAGVDLEKPVVTTCGSGVTACMLALGLHLIGKHDVAVYDGSWAEWGTAKDTPVETG